MDVFLLGISISVIYLQYFPNEFLNLIPFLLFLQGERQVNVCAMLANFSKPTEQKPSLLDHGEVETYFHEFGHVMHQLCSKTQLAKFCGN